MYGVGDVLLIQWVYNIKFDFRDGFAVIQQCVENLSILLGCLFTISLLT